MTYMDQVHCRDKQVKWIKVWGVSTRKLLEGAAAKLLGRIKHCPPKKWMAEQRAA